MQMFLVSPSNVPLNVRLVKIRPLFAILVTTISCTTIAVFSNALTLSMKMTHICSVDLAPNSEYSVIIAQIKRTAKSAIQVMFSSKDYALIQHQLATPTFQEWRCSA